MRPSEMRTMSLTPGARELARDRQVAGLGHARARPIGPMFFSTRMSSASTSRSSSSMRAARSSTSSNTTARPSCSISFGVGRRLLDDRAVGREVAAQHGDPALRVDRVGRRGARSRPARSRCRRRVELLAERAAGDGQRSRGAAAAAVRAAARPCRRRRGSPPCSARPRASGRPAPASRGPCGRSARGRPSTPSAAGDRGQVHDAVGRAADGQQHAHRVLERLGVRIRSA